MFNFKKEKPEFTHLVLTKFNLDYSDILYENEKDQKLWLDPDWIESRFELFEKYCFPSVEAQTEKKFLWIVFFHKDTPKAQKDKINFYKEKLPNFTPLYTEKRNELVEPIKQNIPLKKWVITTRLDNDDGFSIDYIENIQKKFVAKHRTFIDFQDGYSYDAKSRGLNHLRFRSNAFLSLIEDTEISLDTACGFNHTRSMDFGKLKSYKTKPMWVQVAHSDNRLNYFSGKKANFFQKNDFKKRFAIN